MSSLQSMATPYAGVAILTDCPATNSQMPHLTVSNVKFKMLSSTACASYNHRCQHIGHLLGALSLGKMYVFSVNLTSLRLLHLLNYVIGDSCG